MSAALLGAAPSEADTLDEISQAIAAALAREGGPIAVALTVVVLVAVTVGLVRWLRAEVRREDAARLELAARRAEVLSATRSSQEQREWVRVPAALDVKVKHTSGSRRYFDPECRTRDLSGGGVGIFSSRPPPPGESVEFTLDLKDRPPLSLRGVVVRVEPPIAYGEPALVGVKLGPIAETDRDAVVRWVARESTRAAARAREGRVCPVCGRTLADPALEVHPGCVGKESKRPKRL